MMIQQIKMAGALLVQAQNLYPLATMSDIVVECARCRDTVNSTVCYRAATFLQNDIALKSDLRALGEIEFGKPFLPLDEHENRTSQTSQQVQHLCIHQQHPNSLHVTMQGQNHQGVESPSPSAGVQQTVLMRPRSEAQEEMQMIEDVQSRVAQTLLLDNH